MTPTSLLTGTPLRTYQAITGSAPRQEVEWSAVRSLLAELGEVTEEPDGNWTIRRNGHVFMLHPAQTKDLVESGELGPLRRFLQQSETPPAANANRDPHLLLVIDQHEARLYRCQVIGGIPRLLLPHDAGPSAGGRDASRRAARPERNAFFEPMAEALQIAGQIVIFGTATELNSELDQFVAWLKTYHPILSDRILGTMHVAEHDLTDVALLAAARTFYANHRASAPNTAVDLLRA